MVWTNRLIQCWQWKHSVFKRYCESRLKVSSFNSCSEYMTLDSAHYMFCCFLKNGKIHCHCWPPCSISAKPLDSNLSSSPLLTRSISHLRKKNIFFSMFGGIYSFDLGQPKSWFYLNDVLFSWLAYQHLLSQQHINLGFKTMCLALNLHSPDWHTSHIADCYAYTETKKHTFTMF